MFVAVVQAVKQRDGSAGKCQFPAILAGRQLRGSTGATDRVARNMALKEGDSVASIARLEGKGGSNNTKEAAAAPESAPQGPTPAKPPAAKKQSSPKK